MRLTTLIVIGYAHQSSDQRRIDQDPLPASTQMPLPLVLELVSPMLPTRTARVEHGDLDPDGGLGLQHDALGAWGLLKET